MPLIQVCSREQYDEMSRIKTDRNGERNLKNKSENKILETFPLKANSKWDSYEFLENVAKNKMQIILNNRFVPH